MNEYYKILGLPNTATPEEIKKQYNKLVKKYHPDVNPSGADMFEKVQNAYNVLKTKPPTQKSNNFYDLDIDLDKIFRNDMYRYRKHKNKNITKKVTIDISTTVEQYDSASFEQVIILDTGFKKEYTFKHGIVPYKTTQTYTEMVDGVKYILTFHFSLQDDDVKYDAANGRFVKYVKISASDFAKNDTIRVTWNKKTYDVSIATVTSDQLLKLSGKGFYNAETNKYEDLYVKLIVYKE